MSRGRLFPPEASSALSVQIAYVTSRTAWTKWSASTRPSQHFEEEMILSLLQMPLRCNTVATSFNSFQHYCNGTFLSGNLCIFVLICSVCINSMCSAPSPGINLLRVRSRGKESSRFAPCIRVQRVFAHYVPCTRV